MARSEKYTKEFLLEKSLAFIKLLGIEKLSVRELANFIGCSTQPIFHCYANMELFKQDLKIKLREDYEVFIQQYVDVENYLFTISLAYALYSKKEPNAFRALFLSDLAGTRSISEVLETKRNRPTIEAMVSQYEISNKDAENIYRDIRFYTHGMASQLCCNTIQLSEQEIYDFIYNMILVQIEYLRRNKV